MVTILNTSILTDFGSYRFEHLSLQESRDLISGGFQSAVGHQSTCEILTGLLGVDVEMNRTQYSQAVDEVALVFKLNGRPQEGKILTAREIYVFGKLTRVS